MPSSADGPISPRLRVLDDVTWSGEPVPGERTHALLRVLVEAGTRGLSEQALVEEVWGDDVPANPTKALQVVVSRARSATSPTAIERTARGYRLALASTDVDAWALRPEGLRLAAAGEYAAALPLLERAEPDDEVVAALLRSLAAVHGAPAALDRYETYRGDLADRLGVDPSPDLQALHSELLARDRPVREGLLYEASRLIGRADDVTALEAMIRTSRVTSIVGPGGLGKTRLAHLMGRLAEQPVVHFVELAGVTSPEGVTVEVGDVLGVRESVTGRLTSAAARRTDLVSRIVDQVGTAPALLILDNCEHLVDAVADLVSVLVQRTPSLRVLTTTRAPLGIAAERVYQLPQLSLDDAVELFRERATAARPGVRLAEDEVRSLVARLDGLPLAVELAAAKVRVMSVAEIERRIEDRFALLRGGSRDAPERHQTLLAVIDWSWNLLHDDERVALRRLSIFRDGFSLGGAEAVVGSDALGALANLADQSLVTVVEGAGELRYRLLETVREFGQMQLVGSGDDTETIARLRTWGTEFALRCESRLFGPRQVETMTAIRTEEGNLVDLLRRCLRTEDADAVVVVMACLSDFWTIEGSHLKVVNISPDVEAVVVDAAISPELEESYRTTLTAIAFNSMIFSDSTVGRAFDRLEQLGPGARGTRSGIAATVLLAARATVDDGHFGAVEEMCSDDDRRIAQLALQWSSQFHENQGEIRLAQEHGLRALALTDEADGPWGAALIRAQLAGLTMQVGEMTEAMGYARDAIPVLDALGADEDVAQLKAVLAMGALEDGRIDEAERIFDEIEASDGATGIFGAAIILLCGRPELDLAAGRVDLGLRGYREAAKTLSARSFPGLETMLGFEPWTLYAEAAAVAAHVLHDQRDEVEGLRRDLLDKSPRILDGAIGFLDFPVFGSILFALAVWELADQPDPTRAERAVRLLVYADRFGYNRQLPSLAWAPGLALAEDVLPGEEARIRASLEGRHAPELRPEVGDLLAELG
ncbi:ATP-binding protein [Nocardioides conyzicola]|uniref:BTAD domain-containing putative transcriptional regulator n=1 Tax=Nocardioides conyzicola TaxID=1651781 RepID=A0ABP8XUL0_9ACTN